MNIVHISSSELKRNVADILNDVYFGKKIAVIKRYGRIVAKIIPADEKEEKTKSIPPLLNKYFGILPDFPNVPKERNFRKRSIKL